MTIGVSIDSVQRNLIHWTLRVPEYGAWRAELEIESAPTPSVKGAAVIILDALGNEWRGSVRAVTSTGAYESVEVMAGAGALDVATTERFYGRGLDAVSVLADLCADVGESADPSPAWPLPQWRTRGQWLIDEVDILTRYTTQRWRSLPSGVITLTPAASTSSAPGDLLAAARSYRDYECPDLPPLTGATIDGWTVGNALYQGGRGRPTVTVYESTFRFRLTRVGAIGGTVTAISGQRIDCELDTGVGLSDIPLWSAAGYVPIVRRGARVIVMDLGDDPRSTVALIGTADSEVDSIELAQGESELVPSLPPFTKGRVLRYGDTIIVPSGPAATPTPQILMPSFPPGPPMPLSRVKA